MATTFYALPDHRLPRLWIDGAPLTLEEFEVSGHGSLLLQEVMSLDEPDVAFARAIHEAIGVAISTLREKVAEAQKEREHVAVLVRTPLTVFVSDSPPRIVTEPKDPDDPDGEHVWVRGSDGEPVTMPGEVGYYAFAVVSVAASDTPVECDFPVICVDEEPSWMALPDLDEDLVRAASVNVRSARGRVDLIQFVVQSTFAG